MKSYISSCLFAVALLSAPAHAATLIFDGVLQGSQEVPANASPGTGSVSLTLDDTSGEWSLTGAFSGLTGAANNAHIHGAAAPGASAGVIVGLTFSPAVTSGTLSGAGTFSAPQMADLIGGLYYVNLHSTTFPGGELRAQLEPVPEPSAALLGALGMLLLVRRRR